jgi:hypothetical protein
LQSAHELAQPTGVETALACGVTHFSKVVRDFRLPMTVEPGMGIGEDQVEHRSGCVDLPHPVCERAEEIEALEIRISEGAPRPFPPIKHERNGSAHATA